MYIFFVRSQNIEQCMLNWRIYRRENECILTLGFIVPCDSLLRQGRVTCLLEASMMTKTSFQSTAKRWLKVSRCHVNLSYLTSLKRQWLIVLCANEKLQIQNTKSTHVYCNEEYRCHHCQKTVFHRFKHYRWSLFTGYLIIWKSQLFSAAYAVFLNVWMQLWTAIIDIR